MLYVPAISSLMSYLCTFPMVLEQIVHVVSEIYLYHHRQEPDNFTLHVSCTQ